MTPRLTLVTLGVEDVARARGFYERLGLRASSAGDGEVAFFDVNGVALAVFLRAALAKDAQATPPPPGQFSGVTLAWNVGSDSEVDDALALALAAGARIAKPAHKTFWGGYAGIFADPDGHLWEIAHNPFWPLDAQGRLTLP